MKKIVSLFLIVLFTAGCACPRYDVRVVAIPLPNSRADWIAVRIDRQTGQAWYSYNEGKAVLLQKPEWHPIAGGVEPSQK